ncbi:hypothetical protein ACIF83_23135 [Streptomyces sp. NPDC085866]|uniref:hypothetical protein n=1 Tax=Streptomyces sp. NPDC085866 TaxID=3365736 RepID=UPI0037D7A992
MPVDLRASARDGGQHLLVAAGEPDTAVLIAATLELAGYRIGRGGRRARRRPATR